MGGKLSKFDTKRKKPVQSPTREGDRTELVVATGRGRKWGLGDNEYTASSETEENAIELDSNSNCPTR